MGRGRALALRGFTVSLFIGCYYWRHGQWEHDKGLLEVTEGAPDPQRLESEQLKSDPEPHSKLKAQLREASQRSLAEKQGRGRGVTDVHGQNNGTAVAIELAGREPIGTMEFCAERCKQLPGMCTRGHPFTMTKWPAPRCLHRSSRLGNSGDRKSHAVPRPFLGGQWL